MPVIIRERRMRPALTPLTPDLEWPAWGRRMGKVHLAEPAVGLRVLAVVHPQGQVA